MAAINDAGNGPTSNVADATTEEAQTPGAPTQLTAIADGQNAIDLSWMAPSDTGSSAITGYRIEVSSNGGALWGDVLANTDSTAVTYRHTGLPPASTRHYRVSAINDAGSGPPSNLADATTEDAVSGVPGAPTSLMAAADGETAIDLSWTAPSDTGSSAITGYRIEVSSNGGTLWGNLSGNTRSTATTYKHMGLSPGITRQLPGVGNQQHGQGSGVERRQCHNRGSKWRVRYAESAHRPCGYGRRGVGDRSVVEGARRYRDQRDHRLSGPGAERRQLAVDRPGFHDHDHLQAHWASTQHHPPLPGSGGQRVGPRRLFEYRYCHHRWASRPPNRDHRPT